MQSHALKTCQVSRGVPIYDPGRYMRIYKIEVWTQLECNMMQHEMCSLAAGKKRENQGFQKYVFKYF